MRTPAFTSAPFGPGPAQGKAPPAPRGAGFHAHPGLAARPRQPWFVTWTGLAIVYAALALFIYPDWINIGVQHGVEETAEVRIFKMPPPDIAFVLILGFTFVIDADFRRALFSKLGVAFFAILAGYAFLGVILGNELNWMREDLRIWMWAVAGFAAFHLIIKSSKPSLHLLAICLISGVVLYFSAKGAQGMMNNNAFLSNDRVWDTDVFNYADMMIIFLGLAVTICALKNVFYFAGVLAAMGLFFYSAVVLSATRSLALALVTVCALAVPSLMFKRNRDIITLRVGGSAIWVAAFIWVAGMLVAATFFGLAFSNSTVLADRWSSGDIDSGLDRFIELGDALRQLGVGRAIIGGGMGYTFESIFNFTAIGLHIGVFVFLLRFGIVPFLAIVFFLYAYVPFKYFQAVFRPLALHPFMRSALLIVLPGILGWALILIMSGGYDHYFFIGVGFSLGVFNEVRARGLSQLCR